MKRLLCLAALILSIGLLAGCQPNYTIATVTPTPLSTPTSPPTEPPTPTPVPTEIPAVAPTIEPTAAPTAEAAEVPVAALSTDRGEFFTGAGMCAVCHINNQDEAGNPVSLDGLWRSSMMANSAKDPYWLAGVRGETLSNPDYAGFIQDKCATCHMPEARFTDFAHEIQGAVFDAGGYLDPANPLHSLAMDGIACSLCHQIEADNFGTVEGFSGHYAIDASLPTGQRHSYGPFAVAETQAILMQGSSGLIPTQSEHVQDSALCGTCHTLYTPTLDQNGEIVGEFAEQMVYPEWQHSSYRDTASCQGCHMPAAEGGVVLSITGGELRSPFMQHVFVGGNFYMPDLIYRYGDELNSAATRAQVDETVARVQDQLQNRTATVSIDSVQIDGGTLQADVTVTSQTGHKLPSGYPARRAWLHVTVTDGAGSVIFESGAFNPDGSIAGNDNDADAALFEPHYNTIDSPDQVQIYEAIMQDVAGIPTTTLLSGAGYLKDNRLLPDGFDKATAGPEIAVYGEAAGDENFVGGSDRITYAVPVGEAVGPFTVTVELRYQSIAYRWAQNLRRHDTAEAARFLGYWAEQPAPAGLLASATAEG